MNIIQMIEKYEELEYDYNQAEEKASEYEKEYIQMTNIGYNEEDFYTHSMATCWSNYENEMKEIQKEMDKYPLNNGKFIANELIKEFYKIEINKLMKKLSEWFNIYGFNVEVFTQPLFFLHSEEGSIYDDMNNCNYINDFNWNINKNDYFIIMNHTKNNKSIKSYNQKEFFTWLKKELTKYTLWDLEVTEELEELIRIIHPKYYF